jgi:hypothetical protein
MLLQAKKLRSLELETLTVITEIGSFGRLSQLRAAAASAKARINEYKGPIDIHLGFVLDIRLRADRTDPVPRRVDIGALVQVDETDTITNASYSVMICRTNDPARSPIVRKVHFDYQPVTLRNRSEPKPTVHMQLCGKFSPHHRAAGFNDERLNALYPDFEKPRIPTAPTSVALILNWLLLEFQTDAASDAILRDNRWRTHVAQAERLVLTPYFEKAARFLQSTGDEKRRFLQTHLYELVGD